MVINSGRVNDEEEILFIGFRGSSGCNRGV